MYKWSKYRNFDDLRCGFGSMGLDRLDVVFGTDCQSIKTEKLLRGLKKIYCLRQIMKQGMGFIQFHLNYDNLLAV